HERGRADAEHLRDREDDEREVAGDADPRHRLLTQAADPVQIDEEIQRLEHHRDQHEAGRLDEMLRDGALRQILHGSSTLYRLPTPLLVHNCPRSTGGPDMTPRFRIARFAAPLVLGLALASAPAAQTANRPLTHEDYDAWRSIYTPTLTRDGRFLVYSYMPQEGDGDLVIRDLKTGQERREGVGAIPPPVIQNADEVNPDDVPAPRSVRIVTSIDSSFALSTTFPSKTAADEARRAKKRP